MRMLFNKFASNSGSDWWTEIACLAVLVLLVGVPAMFHSDPVASGALLIGP